MQPPHQFFKGEVEKQSVKTSKAQEICVVRLENRIKETQKTSQKEFIAYSIITAAEAVSPLLTKGVLQTAQAYSVEGFARCY